MLVAKPHRKLARRIHRANSQRRRKAYLRGNLKPDYKGNDTGLRGHLRPLVFKAFPEQTRATGSLKRHERTMRRLHAWKYDAPAERVAS